MQGHAKTSTFGYVGEDPKTKPLFEKMSDKNGKPKSADNVYISYFTGSKDKNTEFHGKLTAGYGAKNPRNPAQSEEKIGPEYLFGLTIEEAQKEPILIIKTAWGGKSLHTDFRPPSAGPYQLNAWQKEHYSKQAGHGIPKDFEQWKKDKKAATGMYYTLMIEHIKHILADIKRVYPAYDTAQGYEIAGFVWFQGWNDMVDSHTYLHSAKQERFSLYSDLLGNFIRDVRKDLSTPKMPFVIGVMGVGGLKKKPDYFRKAMAAPASLPEFKGNVLAIKTAPFWDPKLQAIEQKFEQVRKMRYFLKSKNPNHANKDGSMTQKQQNQYLKQYQSKLITAEEDALWKRATSNAGYHYLGCAKIIAQIGEAFAKGMIELEKK